MRETGIVRRIDELGRVVIPKEIRKTLRIKEGDPLEIFTDKEELVLKKYSPVLSVMEFAGGVAESISKLTEKTCVITDTDNVIFVSGGKKEMLGKNLSGEIDKVMKERKSVVVSSSDGGKTIPVIENSFDEPVSQIIVPIIASGDVFGSVILSGDDKQEKLSDVDIKMVRLGAMFLAKQLE
ncbi:MAG: AbrB/MazE/SpoVT family DNA-binding domain-containing protein [Clostridia bacterium]|nr:AbrB/MazE/SpoVT family DNA-binding domain-containing protein [Clostridia bacterium]